MRFFIIRLVKFTLFLSVLFSAIFFGGGCGKRKPPLPPSERVLQRVILSGFQRGNAVNLTWQMPARNAPDGSIVNISRVEIYRLAENLNSPEIITEEDFSARSTLISSLPVTDSDFALKTFSYSDILEFAGQAVRLRYSIRFVNDSGQRAAFSNFLLLEPVARIAKAPNSLTYELSQTNILLKWNAPTANVDESQPANILGYNIYRTIDNENNFTLLNKMPVTQNQFSDSTFEFDKSYKYFLRSISINTNGEAVESQNSEIIDISTVDKFPPDAPQALTIAAAPNVISIFFIANSETDLAGYRLYRTQIQSQPKPDWELLTTNLLSNNTYQDKSVKSGNTYFYYLVAVDTRGNVSLPSEVVSETVP